MGSGPAGIFAAWELARNCSQRVLLLDKGSDLSDRCCPSSHRQSQCRRCDPCDLICGWGGAGAFSDGKLTLTPAFGGFLEDYVGEESIKELIDYVDGVYLAQGAPPEVYGGDEESVKDLQKKAATADLNFIPAQIRHLGTENCYQVLSHLRRELEKGVDIKTGEEVRGITTQPHEGGARVTGVVTSRGEHYQSSYVVMAPGRSGASWTLEEAKRLGLSGMNNPVDIGLRIEVPAVIMEHITSKVYESKLIYYSPSFDDRVRTFCMNPYGEVVTENNQGLITVNGHSYAHSKTENTNFALLVSKTFTEPFKEPISYGRNIASLANMLGEGALIQRLGDLMVGRRSTEERIKRGLVKPTLPKATPGDLSLVMPYRHLLSIREMMEALDEVAPGINSRHTLLYGVEVKFYSYRLELSSQLETQVQNLFAIGDGAGITRGLIQASASGVLAGREIARRSEKD